MKQERKCKAKIVGPKSDANNWDIYGNMMEQISQKEHRVRAYLIKLYWHSGFILLLQLVIRISTSSESKFCWKIKNFR